MRGNGDRFGCHRVIQPLQAFPQSAEKLNASLPIFSNEILIRVDRLNLDSASFRQLREGTKGDPRLMAREILRIVQSRGKMHNPVTNSGGTLLGTVEEIGNSAMAKGFRTGDRIATLVSLTLTPLHLDQIEEVDLEKEQVRVKGHAILFDSGIAHRLPVDMSEPMALAIFDVCGAPALVAHMARVGETIIIFGGGKAGLLVAAEAKKRVGRGGHVIVLEKDLQAQKDAKGLPFVNEVYEADLTDPRQTLEIVTRVTQARMADLVVNCVNVPKTEMASVLAAKRSGTVLFFNMATHFQSAVLGAEGVGHETRLVMGNGYFPGHADLSLNLVREFPELRAWFEKRFAG